MPYIANEHEELLARFLQEQREYRDAPFALEFGLPVVSTLIAQLQLAARHPQNTGASRAIAQEIVTGLIRRMRESGFHASADVAELGQAPANDVPN